MKLRERGSRLQLESDESDLAATKSVEYDDAEDATPSVDDDEQGEIERMMLEADAQHEEETAAEKTAEVETEKKATSTPKKAHVAKKKKAATAKPKKRAVKS